MTKTLNDGIKALIRSGAACPHMEMDDDGTGHIVVFGPISSPDQCGSCRTIAREKAQAAVKRAKKSAAQEAREMRASLSDEEKQAILLADPTKVLHTWEGAGYWRKARFDEYAQGRPTRTIDGKLHIWEPPAERSRVMTAQRAAEMEERKQERIDRALGYNGRTVKYT